MANAVVTRLNSKRTLVAGLGVALLAGLFRLYQLTALPPGLSGGEAAIGMSALNLLHHGTIPAFNAATAYAPLWVALQAVFVALFGHTELALRLLPTLVGLLAVGAVWLWAKDWFDARVAWIAAVLMAVTPWAVVLSRSAGPAVMATLLVPVSLWAGGRALSTRRAIWWWLSGVLILIDLGSGPTGWTVLVMVYTLGAVAILPHRRKFINRASLGGIVLAKLGLLAALIVIIVKHHRVHELLSQAGASSHVGTLATNTANVLGMFNVHGDDNFLHNFNGQPMLNAFVGLMFVAGFLVALTRFGKRRYSAAVTALIIGLIPAIASTLNAPNAAHAAAALPLSLVLAGIGTSYMLDLWHATFPINSAARSTGLAAILLLLGLSVFQGYVQTFRAWSGSAETYQAYDEAAVAAAHYLTAHASKSPHLVVAANDEQTVIAYLDYGQVYQALAPAGIITLPTGMGARQFIITAAVRDEAARNLALKFAGGKLVPHYSSFSQNELFYTYETTQ